MALPTRGQPDWDDELGNHIAGLEADLQSAKANAEVAVSNANEARNVAQSVRNSVLGGSDVANAALINDNASATAQALSATFATKAELATAGDTRLDLLNQRASADRELSMGKQRVAFAETPEFSEDWADLTGWGATGVVVSGGRLYGAAGSTGAATAFQPGTKNVRIKGSIQVVTGSGGGGLAMIGVAKGTAGAAPVGSNLIAIGIREDQIPVVYLGAIAGGTVVLEAVGVGSGVLGVTIVIDATNITMTLTKADASKEWRYVTPRSGLGTISSVVAWNNDARGAASGHGVNQLGAKAAIATLVQPLAIEAAAPSVARVLDSSAQNMRVALPQGYDSRVPVPFVFYCHGSGDTDLGPVSDPGLATVSTALHAAGWGIASSGQHSLNWGNQAGVDALTRLYKYVRDTYPLGPIVIMGSSMGGLAALNAVMQRDVPAVGLVLIQPVTNLANMFANNAGTYSAPIRAAHGIAADGSDYATKTAGRDPMLADVAAFRGLPMRFYASPSDVTVTKAQNTDLFKAKVQDYVPESVVMPATGVHGDNSHYQPSDVVSFVNRCIGR